MSSRSGWSDPAGPHRPRDVRGFAGRSRTGLVAVALAGVVVAVGLVAAVLIGVATSDPVGAQPRSAECTPDETIALSPIQCRFSLPASAGAGPFELLGPDGTWADCWARDDEIVCDPLLTPSGAGPVEFELLDTGGALVSRARVQLVAPGPAVISPVGAHQPYARPGRPLRVWVSDGPEPVWVRLIGVDSDREYAVRLRPGGERRIPVEGMEPGHYLLQPCQGAGRQSCEPGPLRLGVQIGGAELTPLVEGHNRADADRINLVFAGSGWDSLDAAQRAVSSLLGWDGPQGYDVDLALVDTATVDTASDEVLDLTWGPFAVEPLRSARHLFNLWFLEEQVVDEMALFHDSEPRGTGQIDTSGFGLDHASLIVVHPYPTLAGQRSEAGWNNIAGDGSLPEVIRPSGIRLAVDAEAPWVDAVVLTHELGHALFDLRDEYDEPGSEPRFGWPNCAPDRATARSWWAASIDEVDPFVEDYLDTLAHWGVPASPELRDRLRIGIVEGGCFSDTAHALRPSNDSIMRTNVPVFGAVNRAWAEQVLARFSGRAPATQPGDARLACHQGAVDEPVTCAVELAERRDPAIGTVLRNGERELACRAEGALVCPGFVASAERVELVSAEGTVIDQARVRVPLLPPLTALSGTSTAALVVGAGTVDVGFGATTAWWRAALLLAGAAGLAGASLWMAGRTR